MLIQKKTVCRVYGDSAPASQLFCESKTDLKSKVHFSQRRNYSFSEHLENDSELGTLPCISLEAWNSGEFASSKLSNYLIAGKVKGVICPLDLAITNVSVLQKTVNSL